jgi:hypothetical protein
MRRHRSMRVAGIGRFAGNVPLPQGLSEASHADQLDAMSADPGLRLAGSRGKRVYRGGGLSLHIFAGGQGGPATEAVLDALGTTINRSRAAGQFRGTPGGVDFNNRDAE